MSRSVVAGAVVVSALVLANLLYVVAAVAVATVVSTLYVLRHRKPTSLEAGIESFSRELRALAPDQPPGRSGQGPSWGGVALQDAGNGISSGSPNPPEPADAGEAAGDGAPGAGGRVG
jgi:hypothetical protein